MEFEELVRTWFPLGLALEGFGAGLALVTGPLGLAAAGDRRSLMSKPDMDICSALVAQGRTIWANKFRLSHRQQTKVGQWLRCSSPGAQSPELKGETVQRSFRR